MPNHSRCIVLANTLKYSRPPCHHRKTFTSQHAGVHVSVMQDGKLKGVLAYLWAQLREDAGQPLCQVSLHGAKAT